MTPILPLADLPNTAGYHFVGVTHAGDLVDCVVVRDERTGLHRVDGEANYEDLKGWMRADT